jgi:hypothetical protein
MEECFSLDVMLREKERLYRDLGPGGTHFTQ